MIFIAYDQEGRISQTGHCVDEQFQYQSVPGCKLKEVSGLSLGDKHLLEDYYVDNDTITQRPDSCGALSTDTVPADASTEVTISDVKVGAIINVLGPVEDSFEDDGTVSLTFSISGEYTVRVEAPFPAKPKEYLINAT